jgi:hypothetical protein
MHHSLSLALLLALALTVSEAFADARRGEEAYRDGDYAEALEEWIESARGGDPASLIGLGRLHEAGQGVRQDLTRAHLFYNLAAFRGDTDGAEARDRLEQRMRPEEVKRAKDQALDMAMSGRYLPPDMESGVPPAPRATAPAPKPAAPPPGTAPIAPVAAGGPPLDIFMQCRLDLSYEDKGSGGSQDLSIYVPHMPGGYAAIGGYAQGNYHAPDGCVALLDRASPRASTLLAPPADWQLAWNDKGSGAAMDGSVWTGVPPSPDFVCLGAIGLKGYFPPPTSSYVCVHRCLTQTVQATNPIWTEKGTGAQNPLAIYRLPYSNSFAAFPDHQPPQGLIDLNPHAVCP